MDRVNVISQRNVEAITIQIFFMQLDDIKKECASDALSYTDRLMQAWSDYSTSATRLFSKSSREEQKLKLATLMNVANCMVNMLTPNAKMKLLKQCQDQSQSCEAI